MASEYLIIPPVHEDNVDDISYWSAIFDNSVGAIVAGTAEFEGKLLSSEEHQGGLSRREIQLWATEMGAHSAQARSALDRIQSIVAPAKFGYVSSIYDAGNILYELIRGDFDKALLAASKVTFTTLVTTGVVAAVGGVAGAGILGVAAIGILAGVTNYASAEVFDNVIKILFPKVGSSVSDDVKISVTTEGLIEVNGRDIADLIQLNLSGNQNVFINAKGGVDDIHIMGGDNVGVYGGQGADIIAVNSSKNAQIYGGAGNDTISVVGSATVHFEKGDGTDILIIDNKYNSKLILGDGFSATEISLLRNGNYDAYLNFSSSPLVVSVDGVVLKDFLNKDLNQSTALKISFNDGSTLDAKDLMLYTSIGDVGALVASWGWNERIDGGQGSDSISLQTREIDSHTTRIVRAGGGDDTISFFSGDTIIEYGAGHGHDKIHEYNPFWKFDIKILSDLNIDQLSITYNGNFVFITSGEWGASDVIEIHYGYSKLSHNINSIELANGTILNSAQIATIINTGDDYDNLIYGMKLTDNLIGNGGVDRLYGRDGDDSLNGGSGNDYLDGGEGKDFYIFDKNWGVDKISENLFSGDTLRFDYNLEDLSFKRVSNRSIEILSKDGDAVTISEYSGKDAKVEFADGSFLQLSEIYESVKQPTSGNDVLISDEPGELYGEGGDDTLFGSFGDDVLNGGTGNDSMIGGKGNDIYYVNSSYDFVLEKQDEGIDKVISSVSYTLGSNVENLALTASASSAIGNSGNNRITGNDLRNWIYGKDGDDILEGGRGDDILYGGNGDDTYIFKAGDGNDTIQDGDASEHAIGHIVFTDRDLSDFRLVRESDSLTFESVNGGDSVKILNFFWDYYDSSPYIDLITFSNSQTLSFNDIASRYSMSTEANDEFYGSHESDTIQTLGGNDHIYGREGNDFLNGGVGDDFLDGGDGSDTYFFSANSELDIVYDSGIRDGDSDRVLFGEGISIEDIQAEKSGDDLLLISSVHNIHVRIVNQFAVSTGTFVGDAYPIEKIEFTNGETWDLNALFKTEIFGGVGDNELFGNHLNNIIYGESGDDIIDGLDGDDELVGGEGDDTYLFGYGSGKDVISENGNTLGIDSVRLKEGITESSITVSRSELDLIISLDGSDHLTVNGFFQDIDQQASPWGIEQIIFPNGTIWDRNEIIERSAVSEVYLIGTESSDYLSGRGGNDVINGLGGSDTLYGGAGDDILDGGSEYDYLIGELGNDTLIAGAGGAFMSGGDGEDTYIVDLSLGSSTIAQNNSDKFQDIIELSGSSSVDQFKYQISGTNLFVSNLDETNTLQVNFFFGNGDGGNYNFSGIEIGGTLYSVQQIRQLAMVPTDGNDSFNGGDESDLLSGANGDDLLLGAGGDDFLDGGDGTDTLVGDGGNDFLWGGAGADTLVGGNGSDKYFLQRGDERDRIFEDGSQEDYDQLVFGQDITKEQLWFSRSEGSNDLVINIVGTTDMAVINSWFSDSGISVDEFVLSNGVRLINSDVQNLVDAMAAFSPPAIGNLYIPENDLNQLQSVISANWN